MENLVWALILWAAALILIPLERIKQIDLFSGQSPQPGKKVPGPGKKVPGPGVAAIHAFPCCNSPAPRG